MPTPSREAANPAQQAGFHCAAPAVVDEHPADAQLAQQCAGALLHAPAENDPGGSVIFKIKHGKRLLIRLFFVELPDSRQGGDGDFGRASKRHYKRKWTVGKSFLQGLTKLSPRLYNKREMTDRSRQRAAEAAHADLCL